MSLSRRQWLEASGLATLGASLPAGATIALEDEPEGRETPKLPAAIAALKPMLDAVTPISTGERLGRVRRAQQLMEQQGLDAILIASGTSLDYFTGAHWGNSERFFGVVIPKSGSPAWVTPAFEKGRALEQVQPGDDVRAWEEHESPYQLVASILSDRHSAGGRIGIEETVPFVFAESIGQAVPAARLVSATPVTAGCRMIKDAHELALMRRAAEITLTAHRAVFASLTEGLTQAEVAELSSEAHRRLGMRGGALVLFGADAAFPHGTTKPQPLRKGDLVLIDGGGRLHGYASDITRTGVFGAPATDRQKRVWDVVKKAQEAAFAVARPGVECQAVDQAARKVIEDAGFGPGYKYFSHRVGHGIGMDGHEWTYLVKGNTTALKPGMCFSDEPGIYIPGELGVRHEDAITITEDGAANLSPKWTASPEDPAGV